MLDLAFYSDEMLNAEIRKNLSSQFDEMRIDTTLTDLNRQKKKKEKI
jgi:hypothetical protein